MIPDPIVEELDRLRAEQMARFNFDFEAFYRDLKEQEKALAASRAIPAGDAAEPPLAPDDWLRQPPVNTAIVSRRPSGSPDRRLLPFHRL
jgi:hypothetical protein